MLIVVSLQYLNWFHYTLQYWCTGLRGRVRVSSLLFWRNMKFVFCCGCTGKSLWTYCLQGVGGRAASQSSQPGSASLSSNYGYFWFLKIQDGALSTLVPPRDRSDRWISGLRLFCRSHCCRGREWTAVLEPPSLYQVQDHGVDLLHSDGGFSSPGHPLNGEPTRSAPPVACVVLTRLLNKTINFLSLRSRSSRACVSSWWAEPATVWGWSSSKATALSRSLTPSGTCL